MLPNPQKTDILIAALNERYESLRTIRERAQNVALTTLGLMLGAAGWLIQSDKMFACLEKAVAIGGLVAALAVLRFVYLRDLRVGFQGQQRTAARLETALQLYSPGSFVEDAEPLYPASWASAGTEEGSGRFFVSMHILIYVGAAFLIFCILFAA